MTTLRQKLVRKKNRKLRRLRELYPELNVKLFYARDFRALMLKYGKLALAAGLSGTSGQVAEPYGVAPDIEAIGLTLGPDAADAAPAPADTLHARTDPSAGGVPARRRRATPTAGSGLKGPATRA
jgi:hypothetical protein